MADTPVEASALDNLREQRRADVEALANLIEARNAARAEFEAKSDPTDEEREAFAAAETAHATETDRRNRLMDGLKRRIKEEKVLEERRQIAARATAASHAPARVVSEPMTYRSDNSMVKAGGHSYFYDLAAVGAHPDVRAAMQFNNTDAALDRLQRHAKEMDVEMPKIREARDKRAHKQVEEAEAQFLRSVGSSKRGLDHSPFERRVTPNRTDGQGGYFVPPLWLQEYIPGLRAGRVAAGLARQMTLPGGTDSINVPKLSTLTQVGIQGADNAPVASVDFTDTAVTANIKTLAGQEDIPLQLLEQSPYSIDEVLLTDLTADYNKRLDLQVVAGNGANSTSLNGGQLLGLYPSTNWSSTNGITYTDASPAAWKMYSVFAAMTSNIAENRFQLGDSIAHVLHPRRAFWFASGTDSQNRPLNGPSSFPSFNVNAIDVASVPAEGLVGQLPWGAPYYHDANVTTSDTAGGGTGQDVAIGALWDDVWLFEGEMRTRVLPEVLSGSLAIRLQVYNYVAMLVRYGQSLAIATGSGFAAPTGAVSSVTF